jgi:predicted RNA binding protein YcfA (HicA-like mRNA interferase family)
MIPPKRLIRALEKAGFIIIRQKGSHVAMRHPEKGLTTSVPQHPRDLKKWLFKSILKQADMTEEELQKLL